MPKQERPEVLIFRGEAAYPDFLALAARLGWQRVRESTGDGTRTPFEEIWSVAGGGAHVHYIDDPGPERRYVIVSGFQPHVGDIGVALGPPINAITQYEVLNIAEAARSDDAKCRSAMDLAVVFLQENADALKQLRRYYKKGSERVRRIVVAALAYRNWPGGLLLLDEIAKVDPDDFIRRQAAKTAEVWREESAKPT